VEGRSPLEIPLRGTGQPSPGPTGATAPRRACHGRTATLAGTDCANVLVGTRGADVIVGGRGSDRIGGVAATIDDILFGGPGRDRLVGGPAAIG
jgi:RTX calcium-binding nonapeptide repeat (4 copies)